MAFCGQCGTKLEPGAAFCQNCGAPVAEITPVSTVTSEKVQQDEEQMPKDPKVKALTIGAAAALLVLIVLIVILVNYSKSINVEKLITFEAVGVDTKGTAVYSLDEEAFAAAVIKAQGGTVPIDTESSEYYTALSTYDVYDIEDLITLSSDKDTELSNGDEVTVNIEYDNDIAKKYGVKFRGKSASFKVEGLKELESVDPFEGLTVSFEGIAPNAYVSFSYDSDNDDLSNIYFYTDTEDGIDKGDKITVYAEWEDAEDYGYLLSETEKEYTCEDVAQYLPALSDISDSELSALKNEASDSIESYFANQYENVSFSDLDYAGAYLLCAKDTTGSYYTQNMLYIIYTVKVTDKSSDKEYKNKKIYMPVYFYNVVLNIDGTLSYDTDLDIMGYTSLYVGWWDSLPGYEKYNSMYNELVLSRKSEYTYETSAEFGGDKTTDDDDSDADDADYILPNSNSEYLTVSDLEGLSKDELRLARNEIYARHGYIFDDDELQEYFEGKDWYSAESSDQTKIAKEFNDYELDNTDLIIQYEKDMGYR